jgi:1-acyl-sn-glycerol-3-phosphate acyltransferase
MPLLRRLYKLYAWLVFAPIMGLSTVILGSAVLPLLFFLPPAVVARLCGRSWARLNSFVTPMRVTVEGREHIDPRQSYVIVSNHQSHFDIFVLYGWLDIDFKWVMKQELRRVPVIGIACERLGHIYVDRSRHEAALASINAAKSRIVDGTSVIFFPEGTRSRDGQLRAFKKGAFKLALDLGLPILPVTITGTRKVLPSDTLDLFPGSVRMIIHPPVAVEGFTHQNLAPLMERTRAIIAAALPPPE